MGVGVQVEEAGAGRGTDGGDDVVATTLAHVDHTLEHASAPSSPCARRHGVSAGLRFVSRSTLAHPMDIGLALPQFDFSVPGEQPLRWATVRHWATRAEALGFHSVWLADHLFFSIEKYGGPRREHGGFDPVVVLGALARATSRVRLGTLVLCAQLRPPAVLAKALATVDVVSNGRLTVGLGAGWYEPEYVAAGIAFERPGVRLAQLAEVVQIV